MSLFRSVNQARGCFYGCIGLFIFFMYGKVDENKKLVTQLLERKTGLNKSAGDHEWK